MGGLIDHQAALARSIFTAHPTFCGSLVASTGEISNELLRLVGRCRRGTLKSTVPAKAGPKPGSVVLESDFFVSFGGEGKDDGALNHIPIFKW